MTEGVIGEYRTVTSLDGVRLSAVSTGSRGAPPIVFVHGFCQSHLCWTPQFRGSLARRFFLVAFDLRGHGWSDKPMDEAAYREPATSAADVAAVIDAFRLRRPVLVGWSHGGRVVHDYLAQYGDDGIAAIDFVASVLRSGLRYYGADIGLTREMSSDDPQTCIKATRAFVRACYATPPNDETFETTLAYNMLVPPAVRAMIGSGPRSAPEVLQGIRVPVLLTQGAEDRIISPDMSRYGAETIPGARLSLYDRVGHTPFHESPARFDLELTELAFSADG